MFRANKARYLLVCGSTVFASARPTDQKDHWLVAGLSLIPLDIRVFSDLRALCDSDSTIHEPFYQ